MKYWWNKNSKLLLAVTLFVFSLFVSAGIFAQDSYRTEIRIPDILEYRTLKCDFHMHSVFSDGQVWPTQRVEEAWREGLDAIAITEHIEYRIHQQDVKLDHNRAYEIARQRAERYGLVVIKGAEITRAMPPGHFNAIFLTDANPLDTKEWRAAFKAAVDQGAFIFWNHPGWRQPNEIPIWYDEHTELYEKGWFQGIEIVNYTSYYPLAQQWAMEKNLTLLGNSDIHEPSFFEFDLAGGARRPLTLVFAKEKSQAAIKEALIARRTAVFFENQLFGQEQFLKEIFQQAMTISNQQLTFRGKDKNYLQLTNNSDIPFTLIADKVLDEISIPDKIRLLPQKSMVIELRSKQADLSGEKKLILPYTVQNLKIKFDQGLAVKLEVDCLFEKE